MNNIDRRLDNLEQAIKPNVAPLPIYVWSEETSNERPAFYDDYDWLYLCVEPHKQEVYICAADKGKLPEGLKKGT